MTEGFCNLFIIVSVLSIIAYAILKYYGVAHAGAWVVGIAMGVPFVTAGLCVIGLAFYELYAEITGKDQEW